MKAICIILMVRMDVACTPLHNRVIAEFNAKILGGRGIPEVRFPGGRIDLYDPEFNQVYEVKPTWNSVTVSNGRKQLERYMAGYTNEDGQNPSLGSSYGFGSFTDTFYGFNVTVVYKSDGHGLVEYDIVRAGERVTKEVAVEKKKLSAQ